MTWVELVKEYFPSATDEQADYILWGETGFPCFFNIPKDGLTVEECLRKQLVSFKKELQCKRTSGKIEG